MTRSILATNMKKKPFYRDDDERFAKGDIAIEALAEVEQSLMAMQFNNALAVAKAALEKINALKRLTTK